MCVISCMFSKCLLSRPLSRYPFHLTYLSALQPVPFAGFLYPCLLHHSINVIGQAILPFIIFQGKYYLSTQYKEEDLLQDQVIRVSKNSQIINKLSVEQLEYFNRYIKERTISSYYLLVLDSYKSYSLINFYQLYKEKNIITLYIPLHLLYLLQLLNVRCFTPLKKAYKY